MKLQEFFTQQFDTSKRALSTWGPGPYLPPKAPVINAEKGAAELCKHVFYMLLGDIFSADCSIGSYAQQESSTTPLLIGSEMICNSNELNLSAPLSDKVVQRLNMKHAFKKIKTKCSGRPQVKRQTNTRIN